MLKLPKWITSIFTVSSITSSEHSSMNVEGFLPVVLYITHYVYKGCTVGPQDVLIIFYK